MHDAVDFSTLWFPLYGKSVIFAEYINASLIKYKQSHG